MRMLSCDFCSQITYHKFHNHVNKTEEFSEIEMSPTRADLWENSEITKIKERTILEWEIKKKEKARRKLKKIEEELERKKAKAIWEYNNELIRIDKIVGGAKAQAQEKQRKEEFKAKDKANRIRERG